MAIAVLYDVHGNLPALEAVLAEAEAEGVDGVVVGGDVLPGPLGEECLESLRTLRVPVRFLLGNGDRVVLAARRGLPIEEVPAAHRAPIEWHAGRLSEETAGWIATWPLTVRLTVAGVGETLFCHATPRSDTEIVTRRTPEDRFGEAFGGLDADLVVCGHTHMQFDRSVAGVRVLNAGSVGMPFAPPGAYWLLLGPGIELRRTELDLVRAADRVRDSSYPGAAEFADRNVLDPPSEDQMLALFEPSVGS